MFRLFKRKKQGEKIVNQLLDLNGNEIGAGDHVFSFRYELGNCIIIKGDNGLEYESLETKKRVNWTLMIDAATERQKVKKIDE